MEAQKRMIPEGSCDCHHHIVDIEHFAIDSSQKARRLRQAPVEEYIQVKKRLGLSRNVIVAVSAYGYDNRNTLAALKKMGSENTRAIFTLDNTVTDEELEEFHKLGVRGIRIWNRFPYSINYVKELAPKMADLGWHMCILLDSPDDIVEMQKMLRELPCPIVFDHRGFVPDEKHPAFSVIADMMRQKHAWVKISGLYYGDQAPEYSRNIELSKRFVDVEPSQILWGTDWPHHGVLFSALPKMEKKEDNIETKMTDVDTAALLDKLTLQVPDKVLRHWILVENPARLYGFKG